MSAFRLAFVVLFGAFAARAPAATITVTDLSDQPGSCPAVNCTLRAAIANAEFVLGSMRANVPFPLFVTHTASAPAAMSLGLRPIPRGIVAVTPPNSGSILLTV